MFHAAQALFREHGLTTRRHSGVPQLLWEHFVKPGRLDPKYRTWLMNAFDARLQGDYGVTADIAREDAAMTPEHAREFPGVVNNMLGEP